MNLIALRKAAFVTGAVLLICSLGLLLVSVELPAFWVLIPFAVVFALAAVGMMSLAQFDPYSVFQWYFSWRCLWEYAKEQPGDKIAAVATVWFGGWVYANYLMGRITDSEQTCNGVCGVASSEIAPILAIEGLLAVAAAIIIDAAIFWQQRRREHFYP